MSKVWIIEDFRIGSTVRLLNQQYYQIYACVNFREIDAWTEGDGTDNKAVDTN